MLKAVEQLCRLERSRVGNHCVESLNECGHTINNYIYHSTIICAVNENTKMFMTSDGGYDTSSTKRAISSYRKWHESHGYFEVFNDFSEMVEHIVDMTCYCEHGGRQYRCYFGNIHNRIQPTEVTVETRKIGTEKSCKVTVASTEYSDIHVYEFTYNGVKTMTRALINKISCLF